MESLSPTLPLSLWEAEEAPLKRRKTSFVCANKGFDTWSELPLDVLKIIASYLDRENKLAIASVCKLWNRPIIKGFMVDVRTVPEMQELGVLKCQEADQGRKAFRQLKSVIDLVGGLDCFKKLPVFDEKDWPPDVVQINSLGWRSVSASVVRGKTLQGRLYIIFCYLHKSEKRVGYLLQNGIGEGWRISFGFYRLERTRRYYPIDPVHFTRAQGVDPGNLKNTIDKVDHSMEVMKRLFQMHLGGLEKGPIPFNRTTSNGNEKGTILLREAEISPMEISDGESSEIL